MASPSRVILMGAATSAGTHHAGQERAPDARWAADDAVLVVLGGDCTISLGVLAGLFATRPPLADERLADRGQPQL